MSKTSKEIKTSIDVARKAIDELQAAFDKAVAATRDLRSGALVRGATVMVKQYPYKYEATEFFNCSDCNFESWLREGLKFCAGCGSEIIRFHRDQSQEPEPPQEVRITFAPVPEPKETRVFVSLLKD